MDAAPMLDEPTPQLSDLEELFRQHHRTVFAAAYRVTGSAGDAEDVLQTVFLRLARREDPLPDAATAGAYLRRAAVNGALDVVRGRHADRRDALEAVEGRLEAPRTERPDDRHRTGLLADALRTAIAGLDGRMAEMFTLRYFEGLGNRDIAQRLGTSPGTVAVTLHRARARLQSELAPRLGGIR